MHTFLKMICLFFIGFFLIGNLIIILAGTFTAVNILATLMLFIAFIYIISL